MRQPDFWRRDNGLARLLDPLGRIVGAITTQRATAKPVFRPDAPVISVGNLTVGGTGKTPVAISLVARLLARGGSPAVILRGYGGRVKGPLRVTRDMHVIDVGDEALVHAAHAPTWVARNRAAGARLATQAGASVLVLDDGHQHPGIAKDLALVVVDGRAAFGNGRIVPAGPLRETVADGLARADAIVLMGDDAHDLAHRLGDRLPILRADLVAGPDHASLRGQKVVAFAGIGDPRKFFATLEAIGARVVARHPFDDHHDFAEADIQPILDEAFAVGAIPVTTAKDAVRLVPDQRQQVNVLSVDVAWENESALEALLDRVIATKPSA
jgi:tetraacyldisaccharide 4'-kinase